MDQFGVQKPSIKALAETPNIPEIKQQNIEIANVVLFYSGSIKNLTTEGELSATGMSEKTGVLVRRVPVDGIFQTIKLKKNDVILKVNGININNVTEFRSVIDKSEMKTLIVWRDQKSVELKK